MNKHGGMAIGGSKFVKPEKVSKRPVRKDGKEIGSIVGV
jgi:hypothetical protein